MLVPRKYQDIGLDFSEDSIYQLEDTVDEVHIFQPRLDVHHFPVFGLIPPEIKR